MLKSIEEYPFWRKGNRFYFSSEGKNGKFLKSVKFTEFHENIYELELEDYIEKLDVYAINTYTDNGDVEKIYHTVFSIMVTYLESNPSDEIIIRGRIESIHRLHRFFISNFLPKVESYLNVRMFSSKDKSILDKPFDSSILCDGYIFKNK